ncbi:MAG: hypothetical protein ACJAYJ_004412 [Saprospiraceae bacterium]
MTTADKKIWFFDKLRGIKYALNFKEGENCKFFPSNKNNYTLPATAWVENFRNKIVFVPKIPFIK